MTMAYKVEELLALRDSVSESAVSMEKFPDEEVIKEHVLRPYASADAIATHSENSHRPSVPTKLDTGASGNKKPSPSPSVKRGKAERLLKDHCSPPGLRVTAGGRIVPSDLPQLSSPRYLHNNSETQESSHVSPTSLSQSHLAPDFSKVATNGSVAYNASGQLCQYVNNQLLPLNTFNGLVQEPLPMANSLNSSISPVTPFAQGGSSGMAAPPGGVNQSLGNQSPISPFPIDESLSLQTQLQILQYQYDLLKREERILHQNEVIQGGRFGESSRQFFTEKKVYYVKTTDTIRKQIKVVEAQMKIPKDSDGTVPNSEGQRLHVQQTMESAVQQAAQPSEFHFPYFGLPFDTPAVSQAAWYQRAPFTHPQFPASSMLSSDVTQFTPENQGFSAQVSLTGTQYQHTLPTTSSGVFSNSCGPSEGRATSSPTWLHSTSRHSRAVEIKDPRGGSKKAPGSASTLNSASSTYDPNKTTSFVSPPVFVPPTPPPIPSPKRSDAVQAAFPWLFDQKQTTSPTEKLTTLPTEKLTERSVTHKPSISSVCTADFFPTNTHEHSSKTTAPHQPAGTNDKFKDSSTENGDVPVTPDKHWPPSPWNSNICSPIVQTPAWKNEPPPSSNRVSKSASRNVSPAISRKPSARQYNSVQNSPTSDMKPTTYLRGFHDGISRKVSPELLKDNEYARGFAKGLAETIQEGKPLKPDQASPRKASPVTQESQASVQEANMKSFAANQQLSIEISPSPRDSAISLSFSSRDADQFALARENIRGAGYPMTSPTATFGSTYNPEISIWASSNAGFPITHPFYDQSTRRRTSSTTTKRPLSSQQSEESIKEQQSKTVLAEHAIESYKNVQHVTQPGCNVVHAPIPRQISGNQTGCYTKVTPLSLQRHYPGHKEQVPGPNAVQSAAPVSKRNRRMSSQFDGAMDDPAQLIEPVSLSNESTSVEAACFKSFPSKGSKEKVPASPAKSTTSPKKDNEISPAKAKLEQIANKVKRSSKKGDSEAKEKNPATMTREEKKKWRENWGKRFRDIRNNEKKEIEQYKQQNPLPN